MALLSCADTSGTGLTWADVDSVWRFGRDWKLYLLRSNPFCRSFSANDGMVGCRPCTNELCAGVMMLLEHEVAGY